MISQEVDLDDEEELRKFVVFLERRRDRPDEPLTHAYAEVYGVVVFEDVPDRVQTEEKITR